MIKKHLFLSRKFPRKNKFGAKRCSIDNYNFDSLKEGKEYNNLKIRLHLKEIGDLKIHPSYPIFVNDKLVCSVELDFEYFDFQKNKMRYIDVKGMKLPMSSLKRKLVEAQLNIQVEWI